jgi:hypothetical protein
MKMIFILLGALYAINESIGQNCQPCIPGIIRFYRQGQVDSFPINYPNCTQITGIVAIMNGGNITNLNGLCNVTSIGQSFEIEGDSLTNLSGLSSLTSIGVDLLIYKMNSLTSLEGLENLTSIGRQLSVTINKKLTSLSGLENLTSIGGGITISVNTSLTTLDGLENVHSIGGALEIEYDSALTSLSGLEGLTSINGDILLRSNDSLISLDALYNLVSIGGWSSINVYHNNSLTSLAGLDNIDANFIKGLWILNNSSLSNCAIKSVCDYLTFGTWGEEFTGNASGCNSVEEVDSACYYLCSGEQISPDNLKISPNPASDAITLKTSGKGNLSIYNLNGKELLRKYITEPTNILDVSHLSGGVYIVKLVGEKIIQVGKVIKE